MARAAGPTTANRLPEALGWYGRAQVIAPGAAEAWYYAGLAHQALDDQEQAEQDFAYALALNPAYAPVYFALAEQQWQAGEREAAKASARRGIELDATSLVGYRLLGLIFSAEGNSTEARAMYQRILELAPKDAEAHAALQKLGNP